MISNEQKMSKILIINDLDMHHLQIFIALKIH